MKFMHKSSVNKNKMRIYMNKCLCAYKKTIYLKLNCKFRTKYSNDDKNTKYLRI